MISFSNENIFLVTGASSGIGKSISLKLNEIGAAVIGVARNEEKLLKSKNEAKYPDKFHIELNDLTSDQDNCQKWLGGIAEKYGKLTGIVHSAGIQYTLPLGADKVSKAKELFDINYFAAMALLKGFSKKTVNAGEYSSFVIISSFTTFVGIPGITSYSAAKGALDAFVRASAVELSKQKIRVNSVNPGHVITEMFSSGKGALSQKQIEALEPKYPLGLPNADDVANTVAFLLSDTSRMINGQNIIVDGGASIKF